MLIVSQINALFNDISLMRYDIRRCRMIYLLRKYDIISVPSYAKRISSHDSAISYRRYITRSDRNGYHCKKTSFALADKRGFLHGAGGRARTGTVSPPVDFESTTSTNSITPARCSISIIQNLQNSKQNFFRSEIKRYQRRRHRHFGPDRIHFAERLWFTEGLFFGILLGKIHS